MTTIHPEGFLCPISFQIMNDPVIDNEGNSYERESIIKWLETHNTSPITRNPLFISHLKPNRALKDIITSYLQNNNLLSNAPPLIVEEDIPPPIINTNIEKKPIKISVNSIENPYNNDTYVKISFNPIDSDITTPLDLVIVIDVSGSMDDPAKVQINNVLTDVGFTILDITKHAIKVILENMKKNVDRISIVTFSNTSNVIYNLNVITNNNINHIKSLISNLQTDGCTNIWSGLNTGLSQFSNTTDNNIHRVKSLLFMTDGVPSVHLLPPKGIIDSLKNKLSHIYQNHIPSIHTFGFGYNLDTKLLVDIANIGNGYFSFIPDSGFVVTIIINSLANLLTTVSSNTKLYIDNNYKHLKKIIGFDNLNNKIIPLNS